MDSVYEWISAEFARLAEILHDYDRFLRLEMVPPEQWVNLVDKSKVFRVVDVKRNKIVLYASSVANPEDILARVWSMDQNYNHDVVAAMDAKNRALEVIQAKKHEEEIEEAREFAMYIANNNKSRWHHGGRVRDEHFNDLGPVKKHIT
jgi:hypothetical protein